MEVPMLDKEEFSTAVSLYRKIFAARREGATMSESAKPLLDYYNQLTGWNETEPNAIRHHEIGNLGPDCPNCKKPLRTIKARYCAECGFGKEDFVSKDTKPLVVRRKDLFSKSILSVATINDPLIKIVTNDQKMSNEFIVKENGFEELKKGIYFKIIPIFLLVFVAIWAINYFSPNGNQWDSRNFMITVPLFIAIIAFSISRGFKRQEGLFLSYRLIIDEDNITRTQLNTPSITIPHTEVKSIVKYPNQSMTVKGSSSLDVIGIPAQIDELEALELLLNQYHNIEESENKSLAERYNWLMVVVTLGAMAAVYISENRLIVAVTGTILVFLLGYSLIGTQRSKNIDQKTKNSSLFSLLVLASVIAVMYFKLVGK